MSEVKLARTLFDRWASELIDKDKSWKNILPNFDELFYELYKHSVPFNAAEELIKEAIAKHLPTNSTARWTYKQMEGAAADNKSFNEFLEDWKNGIHSFAHQAFFQYYSADIDKEDQSEGEKVHGNMSTKEYILQRKYAESFPEVDIVAIREHREKMLKLLEEKEGKDGDPDKRSS